MTIDPLKEFAALLARADTAERARLFAQARMLAMQQAPEESFEAPIRTLGEYLAEPIEIPPSLVAPTVVVRGELTATLGRAGKGKTTMNLHRILRWGAGLPLFDDFISPEGAHYLMPERPLRICILENEGNAGMFHAKMGVRVYNSGVFTEEEQQTLLQNVMVWGNGGYSNFKLDNEKDVSMLRRGLDKHEPDIVFVEPFRQLWTGDENSSTEMATVVDTMLQVATEFNCGIILSHHERKSGPGEDGERMSAGRGSTVLEGVVNVMENFESVKGGALRELSWSKARYEQPPPPIRLEYDIDADLYRHVAVGELETAVLKELGPTADGDDPLNLASLAEALDEKKNKLRPVIEGLVRDGRVRRLSSLPLPGQGTTGSRYTLLQAANAGGGLEI